MSSARRLYRNSATGRIAGVCSGLADYLDADVTLIRLAWVILSIVPGGIVGGVAAYVAAWIIMPDSHAIGTASTTTRRLTRSRTDRKVAGVCGGLAEYLSVDATAVRLAWAILTIVPGAIVLGVAAYLAAWFVMPDTPEPHGVVTTSTSAA